MTHHETHGKNCICHSCQPNALTDRELATMVQVAMQHDVVTAADEVVFAEAERRES